MAWVLSLPSSENAAYSHSPLRRSSGYSVPHPARFSMTVRAIGSPFTNRPFASLIGSPCASTWALYWTSASTVPSGNGFPAFAASTASWVEA